MGCVCNAGPLQSENYFECSFVTLRFSENEEEVAERVKKKVVKADSVASSPGSWKTSESSCLPKLHKTMQPSRNCIISGELMKYHPGLSFQFASRYCMLTCDFFQYYKSQHSYTLDEKPLFSVPVSEILSVNHVKFSTSEKQLKFSKCNNFYQFEIFIQDEDEMTSLSRRLDKLPLDQEVLIKTSTPRYCDSVKLGKLMKRPIKKSPEKSELSERTAWTVREVEWCTAEKRLLFSARSLEHARHWVSEIESVIIKNN